MTSPKKLFTPVKSMNADEAKSFIAGQEEGGYTLLDVRQSSEYDQEHLPGARLIPLPELPGRLKELDPLKPVIAY